MKSWMREYNTYLKAKKAIEAIFNISQYQKKAETKNATR